MSNMRTPAQIRATNAWEATKHHISLRLCEDTYILVKRRADSLELSVSSYIAALIHADLSESEVKGE